jgi:hypothetical protein
MLLAESCTYIGQSVAHSCRDRRRYDKLPPRIAKVTYHFVLDILRRTRIDHNAIVLDDQMAHQAWLRGRR